MKTLAMSAAVAAFALGAVTMVGAQGKPSGISVRAGIFNPTDSAARALGNTWFAAGVEWKGGDVKSTGYGGNAHWSISADWYGKDDVRAVPVLFNYVSKNQSVYWSGGVGVAFNQIPGQSNTRFAYSAALGWEAPNSGSMPWFLEARYWGNAQTELAGWGLYVGTRF